MRNQLNEMLNELNNVFYESSLRGFPIDVEEVNGNYEITCELAGVKKEDIKIDFVDSVLTISADKKVERNEKTKYLVCERNNQKFRRNLDFGNIEAESIKAKFENGILNITLVAKKPEEKAKRNIAIE